MCSEEALSEDIAEDGIEVESFEECELHLESEVSDFGVGDIIGIMLDNESLVPCDIVYGRDFKF